jgi:hypothetical protein
MMVLAGFAWWPLYLGGSCFGQTPLPTAPTPAKDAVLPSDARAGMVSGLAAISAPGNPGGLVLMSEEAFAIVATETGEVVVAGGMLGQGRVVVFGHPGYLEEAALKGKHGEQTRALIGRAIAWAAGDDPAGAEATTIKVSGASEGWVKGLGRDDLQWSSMDWIQRALLNLNNERPTREVLIGQTHGLNNERDREAVARLVANGTGLVTAGLGWGWLQLNPGKTIQEHPGNLLLRDAGIAFADGIVDEDADDGYVIHAITPEATNAALAMGALETWLAAGSPRPDSKAANAKEQARAHAKRMEGMVESIRRALAVTPQTEGGVESFGGRVDALIAAHATDLDATFATMHEKGLRAREHPLALLAVDRFVTREAAAKPEDVRAFAGHVGFPGPVAKDADRSEREVVVDASMPGWRATGLYVPAGEVVKVEVTLPQAQSGRDLSTLSLQIGSHLDPATRPPLKRLPVVTKRFAATRGDDGSDESRAWTATLASSVGGLLYVDVPKGLELKDLRLRVRGAVQAPHFVLGQTTNEAWRESIRNAPAPWAELESREIALTIPSTLARTMDDPQAVLETWNRIVASHASLEPRRLNGLGDRQARYVPDISVSWGYMYAPAHAPLTIPLEAAKAMLDVETLTTNKHGDVWGLFHELGHWHQNDMWTFEGTGEVTVNIFTLHAIEEICGKQTPDAREETFKPEAMLAAMRKHYGEGAPFEKWKQDPFLALTMYVQLQQAFGWDLYRDVFAEYRGLPKDNRPKTDDQKRDQWLQRLSRATGRNLGPFFTAWGVPTSNEARTSVATLPVWMPEGWHIEPK